MQTKTLITMMIWTAASTVGFAQHTNPNSIVDYLKSMDRDSTFAGRSAEFKKLHPNVEYKGTPEQNRELLSVMRIQSVLQTSSAGPAYTPHSSERETEELLQKEVAEQIAVSPKLASNTNSIGEIGSLLGKQASKNRLSATWKILKGTAKTLPKAASDDPIRSFSEPINQVRQKAQEFNRELIEWKHRNSNDWIAAPPTSGILTKAASDEAANWLSNHADRTREVGALCEAAKTSVKAVQAWDSLDRKRDLTTISALDSEAKAETVRELTKCQELASQIEPQIRQAADAQRDFGRGFLKPLEESYSSGSLRKDPALDPNKFGSWWNN